MPFQSESRSSTVLPSVVFLVCLRTSSGSSIRIVPVPMVLISTSEPMSNTAPSACPAIRYRASASSGTSRYSRPKLSPQFSQLAGDVASMLCMQTWHHQLP